MEMNWEIVGYAAAALTMFGFVPQILKIYRTKSVEDVSLPMLLQFGLGVFLWVLYGLYLKNAVLIVANVISLTSMMIAIVLYVKYRGRGHCENL